MRHVRRFLQCLLISAGLVLIGMALYLPSRPAYDFALAALAFFAFLFFLTLLLREHTESRLNPAFRASPRVLAGFLLLVGIGNLWLAWAVVTDSLSPRSFVVRTVIEIVGPIVPSAIFAVIGLLMLRLARSMFRGAP